ncbi:MAG: M1 family aminopeptidase [Acidobacteria bacterium]|nr:M1 family aminopeptidase [Acidobacteriota bacterium]
MRHWLGRSALSILVVAGVPALAAAPPSPPQGDLPALLGRLQEAVQTGDVEPFTALLAPGADRSAASSFANAMFANNPSTRVTVRERDRVPLRDLPADRGLRLAVDALIEQNNEARVFSWQLDVVRADSAATANAPWLIQRVEPVSFIEGLDRLTVDSRAQYRSRNLVVKSEDAEIRLPDGVVYMVQAGNGVTGAVLIGDGELSFRPSSAVERGQVRIYSGSDALAARFDAVYLRFGAADAERLLPKTELEAEPVDPRLLSRAQVVFDEEAARSYVVDLSDFGAGNWWARPQPTDVVAEVQTRKYGTLTYAHVWKNHEDVSLFDRQRKRHVSLYASAAKLEARGRYYNDADGRDYEVLRYDVDAVLAPESQWLHASTRLRVKVRKDGLSQMTLNLAEGLRVDSISSAEHGRLLGFRARGRNSVVIAFPAPIPAGTELDLTLSYRGALAPIAPEEDRLSFPQVQGREAIGYYPVSLEPSYLYTGRSYWYAQATEPGYATASIRLQVPADYTCVGSGELAAGGPVTVGVVSSKNPSDSQRVYTFAAATPVRYLAFVVSRFTRTSGGRVSMTAPDVALASTATAMMVPGASKPGTDADSLTLAAEVPRRFRSEGPKLVAKAAAMARVYAQVAGGTPYPSLTLALVEQDHPGGHSPAYFSVVNQVIPNPSRSQTSWSGDPATFPDFPDYVLAHEVAHQWWGQAIGTKNYHEQWISEGFAQFFAALYAERVYGPAAYRTVVRQFRRWTMDASDQGAVYLGARVGHIQNDSRAFRALVYNKGAFVLHMLRQLLGDEVFFRGIRQFYGEFRYKEAGTDDVQRVFEAVAGRSLTQFFEGWIFGQDLPRLDVAISGGGAGTPFLDVRIAQEGAAFDVPVPILIDFQDGTSRVSIVPVTSAVTECRLAVDRPVRRASVSSADLAAHLRTGRQ